MINIAILGYVNNLNFTNFIKYSASSNCHKRSNVQTLKCDFTKAPKLERHSCDEFARLLFLSAEIKNFKASKLQDELK